MKLGAVIVGAGKGERLGADVPKCLVTIDSIPLIVMAAWAFEQADVIDSTVLVVPSGYETEVQSAVESARLKKVVAIKPGGLRRQDSVSNGVSALPGHIDSILVHDGARSLVTVKVIQDVAEALNSEAAATVALPIHSTIHRSKDGLASESVERTNLWAAQTPQGFRRDLLISAFDIAERDNLTVTDEITLVREVHNVHARLVIGDPLNIKITDQHDLKSYTHFLQTRAGQIKGGA